jgi:hypothetical protein
MNWTALYVRTLFRPLKTRWLLRATCFRIQNVLHSPPTLYVRLWSLDSAVGIGSRVQAGRSGFRTLVAARHFSLLQIVQTGSRTHQAFPSPGWSGRGVILTIYLHTSVTWLITSGGGGGGGWVGKLTMGIRNFILQISLTWNSGKLFHETQLFHFLFSVCFICHYLIQ